MDSCIYENGKIFTADKDNLYGEAMLVEDGLIRKVGTAEEVEEMAPAGCGRIDLGGRRVIPGFVDAHMHPVMLADFSRQISALPPKIHSIEELVQAIREKRQEQGPDKWIQGWGYDEGKFAERRSITRWDLDRGCSDAPVSVIRTCGHIRGAGAGGNRPQYAGPGRRRDREGRKWRAHRCAEGKCQKSRAPLYACAR